MKIIDAHCHLNKKEWISNTSEPDNDFLIANYGFDYTEGFISNNMKEANIESTIIFPIPSIYVDLRKANRYVLETALANSNFGKFIPFSIIDKSPQYWYERGARGFKQHDYGQNIHPKDLVNYKESYQFMQEKELPLLVHSGIPIQKRIEEIINYAPNLKIILAHCGAEFLKKNDYKPHIGQVHNILQSLKGHKNLYFDISALEDKEIIKMAIEEVGDDKVIFGSDFPEEKPVSALARLKSLQLEDSRLENILHNNICRILNNRFLS
ncbi:MAG: amidohydrolase family protein [Nanoarchaeota archaeon]